MAIRAHDLAYAVVVSVDRNEICYRIHWDLLDF